MTAHQKSQSATPSRLAHIQSAFYHAALGVLDSVPISGAVTLLGLAAIGTAKALDIPDQLVSLGAGVVSMGMLTGAAIGAGAVAVQGKTKEFARAVAKSSARDLRRGGAALSIALPMITASAITIADIKYLKEQEMRNTISVTAASDDFEGRGGWDPRSDIISPTNP